MTGIRTFFANCLESLLSLPISLWHQTPTASPIAGRGRPRRKATESSDQASGLAPMPFG
jgi:hypothetical protein